MKIAAYRAMRRGGMDILPVAAKLARDADAGVRREVALSMRDKPADASLGILVDIARGFDGQDRSYLEALGTGATKKEAALYERLRRDLRVPADPVAWPKAFAGMAWRLHPPAAVPAFAARARSSKLSAGGSPPGDGRDRLHRRSRRGGRHAQDRARKRPVGELATWWLLNRMSNTWANHNLPAALKVTGIYDPETIKLEEMVVPKAPANTPEPSIEEILAPHRRRGARQERGRALPDVPRHRRHRRRSRARAGRLGPRQVRRGDRHAPSSSRAPRSRRATTARSSRPPTA